MILRKYKPILTILNIFLKRDDLPKIKESKTYLMIAKRASCEIYSYWVLMCCDCSKWRPCLS